MDEILENKETSFSNSKEIETQVYYLLSLSDDEFKQHEQNSGEINYLDQSIKICCHIKKLLSEEKILNIILKPRARGSIYGRNNEPKCDLKITTSQSSYNISIKMKDDNAYYITIGKKQDFLVVFNLFDLPNDIKQKQLNL